MNMRELNERDILKICYLYYQEEKTQEEISRVFGVSRFKISRTLKEAKRQGYVTISINDPKGDFTDTEIKLENKFGLQQAIVVRVNEFSEKSAMNQVAEAGAHHLRQIVSDYHIFGVTWGRTVSHVVTNLRPIEVKNLTLVQIGGGLGTIEGTDNNMLTIMLGQKLGAKAHVIPAPVIVRNRSIRDTLFKERKIQQTLEIAKKADLVLFGVGMIGKYGLLWRSGFLQKDDTVKLKKAGAVGQICGRSFNAQGQKCLDELDDRTIGLNLDQIRKIKHKICIAIGREKVAAILGALRGKLANVLVTDDSTAASLLETGNTKKAVKTPHLTSDSAVAS
ncbi:MAG: sugar-binding transcriptional regulator [Deltaproteobacteria bacterium]|nr:sugar-binding transcriptional regulator [Deltaproteobacteria bacterium]